MKLPMKYSLYGILYKKGEQGIWEHEIYALLKPAYPRRALVKIREILVELTTKSWCDELDTVLVGNELIHKYRLQEQHNKFIEYMLPKLDEQLVESGVNVTM
jgi:hypothetical protein